MRVKLVRCRLIGKWSFLSCLFYFIAPRRLKEPADTWTEKNHSWLGDAIATSGTGLGSIMESNCGYLWNHLESSPCCQPFQAGGILECVLKASDIGSYTLRCERCYPKSSMDARQNVILFEENWYTAGINRFQCVHAGVSSCVMNVIQKPIVIEPIHLQCGEGPTEGSKPTSSATALSQAKANPLSGLKWMLPLYHTQADCCKALK